MSHECTTWPQLISDMANELLTAYGRQEMARIDEQIGNRTAAPGRTGAAGETAAPREDTAMRIIDHPDPDSRGARQTIALAAAAHLAYLGLPDVAYWETDQDGTVSVQLASGQDVETALAAYSNVIKGDGQVRRVVRGRHTKASIEGDYRGVHFKVWGQVSAAAEATS